MWRLVMADNKFYWLKLKRDFFKRHDIRIIEAMPNGKDYVLFYLKLLVESIDHDGALRFSETIPYNADMLATITNTNVDIVRSAIHVLNRNGLLEVLRDGTFIVKMPPRDKRDRSTTAYRKWRQSVFERDCFTCQKCGRKGGRLNAHHVERWADCERLRYAISNGVTLCESCHKEIHRRKQDG